MVKKTLEAAEASKPTSFVTMALAIVTALLQVPFPGTALLLLTATFGILAGVSAALSSSTGKGLTILGVAGVVFGTLSAPELMPQLLAWAGTSAEQVAMGFQIAGAILTAFGAPIFRPNFPTGRAGGLRAGPLFLLTVLVVACAAAAKPFVSVPTAEAAGSLRIGVACIGPATNDGCLLVSLHDSTAGVDLATNVAISKGDTSWTTRMCSVIETVVVGAQVTGVTAGKSNSAAVGFRGQADCTATSEQPVAELILQVID